VLEEATVRAAHAEQALTDLRGEPAPLGRHRAGRRTRQGSGAGTAGPAAVSGLEETMTRSTARSGFVLWDAPSAFIQPGRLLVGVRIKWDAPRRMVVDIRAKRLCAREQLEVLG
jgi:hypothetical protein